MSEEFTEADVGAPVFVVRRRFGEGDKYISSTIRKFYKNRNFVVDGSAVQYRASGWEVSGGRAAEEVVRATPENIEKANRANIIRRIENFLGYDIKPLSRATTAQLTALHDAIDSFVNGLKEQGK